MEAELELPLNCRKVADPGEWMIIVAVKAGTNLGHVRSKLYT